MSAGAAVRVLRFQCAQGAVSPCRWNRTSSIALAGPRGVRFPCAHWWIARGVLNIASANACTPPSFSARECQGSGSESGRGIQKFSRIPSW